MTWKKVVNADAGTADKFGGNDLDKVMDAFNGVDVSDPINFSVDINALKANTNTLGDILKNNGTKYLRFAKGTANQVLKVNAAGTDLEWGTVAGVGDVTGGANVGSGTGQIFRDKTAGNLNLKTLVSGGGLSIANNANDITLTATGGGGGGDITGASNVGTGAGFVFKDETAGVLNFKRLTAGSNVTVTNGTNDVTIASTGGGGSAGVQPYTYLLYRDTDNSYKAQNGVTGAVDYTHATDAADVLESIFENNTGSTTPLTIIVAKGDFNLRKWDESKYRRGNFSIIGQGSGQTNFIVTNDVSNIAGNNRVLSFEPLATTYTSIPLAADVSSDSFAVMTNASTGLTDGCYVMIGSDDTMPPGAALKGEQNRVAKIVTTGSSPSHRIILEKYTRDSYDVADAAYIRRVDFIEDIHVQGFTITSASPNDLTASTAFMRFDFTANLHMKDIKFRDWAAFGPGGFHTCLVHNVVVNSICDDLEFEQSPERGDFSVGNLGYAISCRAGCETVYYTNIRTKGGIRHCFTTTSNSETNKVGHPRNIWLVNCNAETTGEASWESHGEGDGINYINCSVHSSRSAEGSDTAAGIEDTDAFGNRCNYVRFINCTVENCRGTAFGIGGGTHGHQIMNCKVKNLELGRVALQINDNAYDVQVNGFMAENIDNEAILVGINCHNIQISNVRAVNCCRANATLDYIHINGTDTHDIQLDQILLDTSANTAVNPIAIDSGAEGITLSNVTIVPTDGASCVFNGMGIKWDERTCRGRQLSRSPFEVGDFPGNHSFGNGLWVSGILTDTGGSRRIEATDGMFREYAQSTLANLEGFKTSVYCERDINPYIRFRFRLENTTGLRFFAGWNSDDTALGPAGADPLVSKSGFMIKVDTALSSNFVIYHNSGDATTTTGATIAAVDANVHTIELRANDAGGGFQWRWDYGAWSAIITTDTPAATSEMGAQFYIENNDTGVAKTLNLLEAYTEIKNV